MISRSSGVYGYLSNEAFLMRDLKHPNIPEIYDMYEDGEYLCIVEEYIDGEDFNSYCRRAVLKEKEILDFAIQICNIIEYLHSCVPPVLYLDLKPENLMYTEQGLYLVDFGSCVKSGSDETQCSFGTVGYAAPEQLFERRADVRTDVYAIGMVLLFMTSEDKDSLSSGINVSHINATKKLKRVIQRCLNKRAAFRFQSVSELKKQLLRLQGSGKSKTQKKENKKLIRIFVTGSKSGAGTTYITFMLGRYFKHRKQKTLIVQTSENGLVQAAVAKRAEVHNGAFEMYGLRLVNCCEGMNRELLKNILRETQVVICDTGVMADIKNAMNLCSTADNEEAEEKIIMTDYILPVCTAGDWELAAAWKCIRKYLCLKEADKVEVFFVFNLMGAEGYYRCIQNLKGITTFRMPVCIDIMERNDAITGKIFDEMFADLPVEKRKL